MSTSQKPAEFFSDWHKNAHIEALVREHDSLVQRAKAAESRDDKVEQAKLEGRVDQVKGELKRLGAEAKLGQKRAERR